MQNGQYSSEFNAVIQIADWIVDFVMDSTRTLQSFSWECKRGRLKDESLLSEVIVVLWFEWLQRGCGAAPAGVVQRRCRVPCGSR